ncbi:Hemolysin-type calcium-binding repeat (2 copies) [Brachionus plicatilis]|uniref:Hemolysin-type calcium-binding repeat (2 copies) n=1 Tax=Brachionus plicatilis TaxID=10195 RepID=A0A3M7QWN4_BRAPC|nr:Hemolysin-type calcium-binding repeat (2 copies) [Brachionus plicatilis]
MDSLLTLLGLFQASLFLCFYIVGLGYQDDTIIDQIKQFISSNPSFVNNLNQSLIFDFFSKQPLLGKYLSQESNSPVNVNWQKFLSSSFGQRIIKKILFEKLARNERKIISKILAVPSCEKVGLKYSTNRTKLPDIIEWSQIGFAKELMNNLNKVVVVAGGESPINEQKWQEFEPSFPYGKNVDRNLIFKKSFFMRSPDTDINCKNESCIKIANYRDYTWIEMAKLVCMTYIPSKKDTFSPPPGYLVSNTIKKCQTILFEDEIYELNDGRGNFYVMHAFEKNGPSLDVVLPNNWTLKRFNISEPLIISPFGSQSECYFNILRDSLGQGYHQKIQIRANNDKNSCLKVPKKSPSPGFKILNTEEEWYVGEVLT